MLGGLYDFFMQHQTISQFIGLIVFILVVIGTASAISCHNCVNDSSKSKEDCKGGDLGNNINIILLVVSILMILYHCYSLFVVLGGKSAFHKVSTMVKNQINKRSGPTPTVQEVEMAFSKAFGSKIR